MGNGLSSTEARALQSQTRRTQRVKCGIAMRCRESHRMAAVSVKEVKKMWKRWHKVSGVHGNEGISDPIMIADVATQLGTSGRRVSVGRRSECGREKT